MDHVWAKQRLEKFANAAKEALNDENSESVQKVFHDQALAAEPVAQRIMNLYEPMLGDYEINNASPWARWNRPRECALRAAGLAENYEVMQQNLTPDAPYITAADLHPWVWTSARPMWEAEARQEAVNAASRVLNARIQQKTGRHDISEYDLVMQVFDSNNPEPGKPRLRLPGDRLRASWRSRQDGVRFFGAGCFRAIRNPAAHEEATDWSEQEALEYLAALSALARWVDASLVETVE